MNSVILERLRAESDEKYAEFQSKLIPNIPREKILGVRIPKLRQIAKEIVKSGDFPEFLKENHCFYEEIMLHGFIIGYAKFDEKEFISQVEKFLPFIDNWAVCDCTVSGLKAIKQYNNIFYKKCKKWLNSDSVYAVRFAVVVLLSYYLDDKFDKEILSILAKIDTNEYYINMAIAWYFSVALVKHYEDVIPLFVEKDIINPWTHNKGIQKAIESYRISDERKAYLRTLKISANKVNKH